MTPPQWSKYVTTRESRDSRTCLGSDYLSIVFKVKVLILRLAAYTNYADGCFSLQNRLREQHFSIVLPRGTTRHSWAIEEPMQHEPSFAYTACLYMLLSYTQHTDYADCTDETILRDYAKSRQNFALQARGYASSLTQPVPSCPLHTLKKKRCSFAVYVCEPPRIIRKF